MRVTGVNENSLGFMHVCDDLGQARCLSLFAPIDCLNEVEIPFGVADIGVIGNQNKTQFPGSANQAPEGRFIDVVSETGARVGRLVIYQSVRFESFCGEVRVSQRRKPCRQLSCEFPVMRAIMRFIDNHDPRIRRQIGDRAHDVAILPIGRFTLLCDKSPVCYFCVAILSSYGWESLNMKPTILAKWVREFACAHPMEYLVDVLWPRKLTPERVGYVSRPLSGTGGQEDNESDKCVCVLQALSSTLSSA